MPGIINMTSKHASFIISPATINDAYDDNKAH